MDRLLRDIGFKIHFAAFAGVNLLLLVINLLTTPQHLWFFWPLLGWGIGIIAHGAGVIYSSRPRPPVRPTPSA